MAAAKAAALQYIESNMPSRMHGIVAEPEDVKIDRRDAVNNVLNEGADTSGPID